MCLASHGPAEASQDSRSRGIGRVNEAEERGVAVDEAGSWHVLGWHARVLQSAGIGGALVTQGIELRGSHDGGGYAGDVGVSQVGLRAVRDAGRQVLIGEPGPVEVGKGWGRG